MLQSKSSAQLSFDVDLNSLLHLTAGVQPGPMIWRSRAQRAVPVF